MSFSLVPRQMNYSIYSIDLRALKARGIKVVFADLDNTLARYSEREPSPELRDWLKELERLGMKLFVVSNSRKSTRANHFCYLLGVDYIKHAGKPKRKGFRQALRMNEITPHEAVMVGDQIFTDILGGNRAHIYTILVRPIANDTIFRVLRHAIEAPFRAFCKNRGNW